MGINTAVLTGASLAIGIQNYSGSAAYGTSLVTSAGTSNDAVSSASGTVATMATNRIQAATLTATNTNITYTNSFSLVVDNAPTASTHVTQTNAYAFGVLAGNSGFGGVVLPLTNVTYDLGTSSLAWRDVYLSHTVGKSAIGASSSLGTNVSSVTPSGNDEAFQIVMVTSGAVSGTMGFIAFGRTWGATPKCVISAADATTGSAVALSVGGYQALNATSGSSMTFTAVITAAGNLYLELQM